MNRKVNPMEKKFESTKKSWKPEQQKQQAGAKQAQQGSEQAKTKQAQPAKPQNASGPMKRS